MLHFKYIDTTQTLTYVSFRNDFDETPHQSGKHVRQKCCIIENHSNTIELESHLRHLEAHVDP